MSEHMDEILASFIQEATEAFSDLENDLLEVERAGADVDADLVNQIFRNVHSVKGTAGFCGLRAIGDLAHEMENVLNLVRNRELVPEPSVVESVLKAADSLVAMVNDLATSGDVDAANAVDISHHVTALKAVAAGESAEVADDATQEMEVEVDISLPDGSIVFLMKPSYELTSRQKRGLGIHVLEVDFIHDIEATGRSATEFLAHLYEHGEVIDSFLSTAGVGQLDDGAPETMTFFVLYAATPDGSDLATTLGLEARCIHDIATAEQTDWSVWPPVAGAAASSAGATDATAAAPSASASAPQAATPSAKPTAAPARAAANETESHGATRQVTSLRVGVQVLDELMNLAGELVLARNQLLQEASKSGSTVDAVATKIDRITSELQEAIMQTRMQQVGTVFNKFPRIVRDLSANLGKECSLTVEGKDVELDKSIIEAIGDPLTHLIRNSVDHGVELPSVRAERGKPAAGSVLLKAFHQAGKVNITIADDGAGIDAERLKTRAVEKGVLTQAEADELTDRQAHLLIFHPGFSTAEQVTDVSGRGVGMDVVRTNIEKLGGTIDIETAIGVGTTMNIQLPLTLAIIPSLVVRNGGKPYAISQANICELIRVKASEVRDRIQKVRGAEVLRLRGDLLPLVRLSTAVGEPSRYENFTAKLTAENRREAIADRRTPDLAAVAEATARDDDAPDTERRAVNDSDRRNDTVAGALNILVLESGEQRYGLVVEALEDSQEIVVKPLGRHMEQCGILAGATILGDGQTALILDVAGIASHCRLRSVEAETDVDARAAAAAETAGEVQSVLLFENHPGEYFAVPNTLVSRIERIKASQIDSVGGLEVLQYRGESLPVLSLEAHVHAKPRDVHESLHIVVFRIAGKDLGLVAPKLSDIRDLSSAIDTVTFREPGILGSQVVEEHTVRFVDIVELAKSSHPDWFRDEAGAQGGERPRILLAEDSGFFRNQLTSFLTSAGYEVDAGEDGEDAWSLLQNPDARYDMLLTDIEMPNLDGLELTRRVRSDPMFAHLPIVALTSLASDDDVQRGMEAGVTRYEVKMDRERLVKIIGEVVSQARQRAGLGAIAQPQTETTA